MIKSKIFLKNEEGERLVGVEVVPSLNGKHPAVVLAHGFAYFKEEDGMFVDIAEKLCKEGIAAYYFDFSGCGESEGDYSETSLTKLQKDLKKILEFVAGQEHVDETRVGLVGQSFGTTVSITLNPNVLCMAMLGSVAYPSESLADLFGDKFNPKGISERTSSNGKITKIKKQFWEDLEKHNTIEAVKEIYCPILFVHGEKDSLVSLKSVEAYFENANEPKEKVIIKGNDHGQQPHRDQAYNLVVNWMTQWLT